MAWCDETMLALAWSALQGPPALLDAVRFSGGRVLSSPYPVADLAAATVAAAGLALAEFAGTGPTGTGLSGAGPSGTGPSGTGVPEVAVDRALCGGWFGMSFAPDGWQLPDPWDPVSRHYRCADGWIRLHTNDPRHRAAALRVLGVPDDQPPADRAAVAAAVLPWRGAELETAVLASGGCAAELRTPAQWRNHHQGMAVAHDPIVGRLFTDVSHTGTTAGPPERPLSGVRVLDLTRVLAGPTATRFLAGFGADVLRIDPPDRDEKPLEAEMTLGKRCARLDLRAGRETLLALLADADVLVHGYRPGAMDGLGLDERTLHATRPGLVEVMLDAYGWAGPWRGRRGFDSLVQMSTGLAHPGADPDAEPRPLPVQALDHATGYLAAAAVLRGLSDRRRTGLGSVSRVSLARTAVLLQDYRFDRDDDEIVTLAEDLGRPEDTFWGPGRRLPGPVRVGRAEMFWSVQAGPLGSSRAEW